MPFIRVCQVLFLQEREERKTCCDMHQKLHAAKVCHKLLKKSQKYCKMLKLYFTGKKDVAFIVKRPPMPL